MLTCIKNIFGSNLTSVTSSRERDMMNSCCSMAMPSSAQHIIPLQPGPGKGAEGAGSWHKFNTAIILKTFLDAIHSHDAHISMIVAGA